MTKRLRKARVKELRDEFLERLRGRFPVVELIATHILPSGTVRIDVYVPNADMFEVMRVNTYRILELVDEDIDVMVVPVSRLSRRLRAAASTV